MPDYKGVWTREEIISMLNEPSLEQMKELTTRELSRSEHNPEEYRLASDRMWQLALWFEEIVLNDPTDEDAKIEMNDCLFLHKSYHNSMLMWKSVQEVTDMLQRKYGNCDIIESKFE